MIDYKTEEAFLGAVFSIASDGAKDEAAAYRDRIIPEMFVDKSLGKAYKTLLEMIDEDLPIDVVTMANRLGADGEANDLMFRITNYEIMPFNLPAYADLLESTYMRRQTAQKLQGIYQSLADNTIPFRDVKESIEQALYEMVSEQGQGTNRVPVIRDMMLGLIDRVERAEINKEVIPTGFLDIDQIFNGGWRPTNFVIVAARPGMGKSTFLLNTALNMALSGKKIALFNLEMSAEQYLLRMISSHSGINSRKLITGLNEPEHHQFLNVAGQLAELGIYIDDTPSLTPAQLRAKVRKLVTYEKVDCIMLDYIQLMGVGRLRFPNRQEEVSYISRQIKMIAKEFNIPVVAACQLSRKCEDRQDKRPQLSDLRESGSLEQDADIVAAIYRDDFYHQMDSIKPNVAEFIVLKHREGAVGTIELYWDGPRVRFRGLQLKEVDL